MDKLRIRVSLEGKEYPLKEGVTIFFRDAEKAYEEVKDYLEFLKYKEKI